MASRVQRGRPRTLPQDEPGQIPRRILKNAKEATDVQPLIDAFALLTEENYTLEMAEIVLHHINPERMIHPEAPPIAPWAPGSNLPRVEREYLSQLRQQEAWGRTALFCGAEALFIIQARCPVRLREETIQKIAPHLDDILAWFKYFQSSTFPLQDPESNVFLGDPSKPCEAIWQWYDSELSGLVFVPQLSRSIETVVDFTISSWLATDPRIGHAPFNIRCWAYNRMPGPGECPILELIMCLLKIEEYQRKIFESLIGTRGLLNRVIKAAIARCEFVLNVDKAVVERELEMCRFKGRLAVDGMLTYLLRTLETVQRLCEHPVVSEKVFRSDFFELLTRATHRWLSQSDARGGSKERLRAFEIARLSQTVLLSHKISSGSHWKATSRALKSLMQGAYLDVVVAALQSPLAEGRNLGNEMLQLLQVQCDAQPSSSEAVYSKLRERCGNNLIEPGFRSTQEMHAYWSLLAYDSESAGTYERGDTSSICDNLSCPGDRRTFIKSRECSRCHTVLYCSPACQQEDWNVLHRQECSGARAHMLEDMQQDKPHYGLSMRLFQAELVTRRARIILGVARIAQASVFKKLTAPTVPLVMELAPAVNPDCKFRSVDEYLRFRQINATPSHTKSASPPLHRHFDSRIETMLRRFDMAEVRAGIRVVEDKCQFGDKTVHVLAKVRMSAPGEPFQLLHCVSRLQKGFTL